MGGPGLGWTPAAGVGTPTSNRVFRCCIERWSGGSPANVQGCAMFSCCQSMSSSALARGEMRCLIHQPKGPHPSWAPVRLHFLHTHPLPHPPWGALTEGRGAWWGQCSTVLLPCCTPAQKPSAAFHPERHQERAAPWENPQVHPLQPEPVPARSDSSQPARPRHWSHQQLCWGLLGRQSWASPSPSRSWLVDPLWTLFPTKPPSL